MLEIDRKREITGLERVASYQRDMPTLTGTSSASCMGSRTTAVKENTRTRATSNNASRQNNRVPFAPVQDQRLHSKYIGVQKDLRKNVPPKVAFL